MTRYRTVEKYVDDRKWVKAKFEDLKEGDEFRLYEHGELLKGSDGETQFTASIDAHPCKPKGNFGIDVVQKEK